MGEAFQLRDVFNPAVVGELALRIEKTWPRFDRETFCSEISTHIEPLSFNSRQRLIADGLKTHLPDDFPEAIAILNQSLGAELQVEELNGYDNFVILAPCLYVSLHGLDHFEEAMSAFYEMTKRFSAEFAIRTFLEEHTSATLERLRIWAHDPNCHVRRLVSEGTRPRLPLGTRLKAFQKDPWPVLALLELLKDDPVLYVRRSVANNLNDIGKDNPEQVVATLERWNVENPTEEIQWLTRHALRSLVKTGHPGALALLGYGAPQLEVQALNLGTPELRVGQDLEFSFRLQSKSSATQELMLDYAIHFVKKNGKKAPKVFKLTAKKLEPGGLLSLQKSHSFRAIKSRPFYPGEHAIELIANGKSLGILPFNLSV